MSGPIAEKDVPACRHCERPIRQRGSAWEHYPTGPNASGRGWQGRRCPGRLTVAEPSILPPAESITLSSYEPGATSVLPPDGGRA